MLSSSAKKYLFAAIGLIFIGLLPNNSLAQNDQIGITVTPITDEFDIDPGEVLTREVRIINPGDEVITLFPRTLNFSTDNEKGQPVFFSEQEGSSNHTLSSWVTFEKDFVRIAKNEEEKVKVIISAPEDAEPGGHYGAILFSTEEPKPTSAETTEIGVVGLVGTLFLATVPGEVVERLELDGFNLPRVSFASPVKLSQTYRNLGNVHVKPIGEVLVKNWSGNQVGVLAVNEGRGNILPQSRREFAQSWGFDPLRTFGIYSFSLQSSYGSPPIDISATKKILIIPYWILAVISLIIIYLGYRIINHRKNKKPSKPVARNINPPKPILR